MGIQPLPIKPGSPTKPVPGWDVRILGDDGAQLPVNRDGAVTVKLPLPPGALPTLWQADDRYVETYLSAHPGFYLTGDGGHIDADGYLFVMGRTDDVINVSGHRLSAGSIEEIIASHPDVAECAVVGVRDDLKGQVPLGFVVLKAGADRDPDELQAELVQLVRDQVGPVAAFKRVEIVARLPKTRSGKILRGTMRRIADGQEYTVPPTIDDPKILDEVIETLRDSSHRA
jgi:propionyl-CoA synthetase